MTASGCVSFQSAGSNDGMSQRRTFFVARRGSTSDKEATGSTLASLQQLRMVKAIAARSPPASLPAN